MSKEKYYWKWKNTIIDFNTISDEKDEYSKYMTKKDIVFQYLGTPDEDIHEWYNGGYSSEYNTALRYAKELGLVEDYIDYEEIRYQLQQKENIIKEVRDFAKLRKEMYERQENVVGQEAIISLLNILDKGE